MLIGVGFLGAGTISKEGSTVHGTATAVSILDTVITGAAVGNGLFDVALVLALISVATLRALALLKPQHPSLAVIDHPLPPG